MEPLYYTKTPLKSDLSLLYRKVSQVDLSTVHTLNINKYQNIISKAIFISLLCIASKALLWTFIHDDKIYNVCPAEMDIGDKQRILSILFFSYNAVFPKMQICLNEGRRKISQKSKYIVPTYHVYYNCFLSDNVNPNFLPL